MGGWWGWGGAERTFPRAWQPERLTRARDHASHTTSTTATLLPPPPPPQAALPGYRQAVEAYFDALCALGRRTLRLLALSLGLEPTYFDAHFSRPMAALRPLHYAPVPSNPEEGLFAAGAHTDYGARASACVRHPPAQPRALGRSPPPPPPPHPPTRPPPCPGMLTFLKTDGVPGLQIFVEGGWKDVPPLEDCFIVNIGDMLERWTNGEGAGIGGGRGGGG